MYNLCKVINKYHSNPIPCGVNINGKRSRGADVAENMTKTVAMMDSVKNGHHRCNGVETSRGVVDNVDANIGSFDALWAEMPTPVLIGLLNRHGGIVFI